MKTIMLLLLILSSTIFSQETMNICDRGAITKCIINQIIYKDCSSVPTNILRQIKALKCSAYYSEVGTTLFSNSFLGLDNLETLTVGSRYTQTIEDDFFKGLNQLKTLNLINVWDLARLREEITKNLPKLKTLNIFEQPGVLEVIDRFTLPNSDSIESLSLYLYRIGYITDLAFSGLPNLKHLDFKYSEIIGMGMDIFHNNPHLKSIKMRENGLKRFPFEQLRNLSGLEALDLSYNNFNYIPSEALRNLTSLKYLNFEALALNQTITEDFFSTTYNLETLILKDCNLRHLLPNTFSNLYNLKHVDLRGNYFPILPTYEELGLPNPFVEILY